MTATGRVLMCPPGALPRLGPDEVWDRSGTTLDRGRALAQWEALRSIVAEVVAPVVTLRPEPWAPALTFTRDLATVVDGQVVAWHQSGLRGPVETPLFARAMRDLGIATDGPGTGVRVDGGNLIVDHHDRVLIGLGADPTGMVRAAADHLRTISRRSIVGVPLRGERFRHLDLVLCDLGGRGWLAHPDALPTFDLTDPAWSELFRGVPVIEVDAADAALLACNVVVGDGVVIAPPMSSALRSRIEELGFEVRATPIDELRKAGGGIHCLTLELPGRT